MHVLLAALVAASCAVAIVQAGAHSEGEPPRQSIATDLESFAQEKYNFSWEVYSGFTAELRAEHEERLRSIVARIRKADGANDHAYRYPIHSSDPTIDRNADDTGHGPGLDATSKVDTAGSGSGVGVGTDTGWDQTNVFRVHSRGKNNKRGAATPGPCDIDVVSNLSLADFRTQYMGKRPVVVKGVTDDWWDFYNPPRCHIVSTQCVCVCLCVCVCVCQRLRCCAMLCEECTPHQHPLYTLCTLHPFTQRQCTYASHIAPRPRTLSTRAHHTTFLPYSPRIGPHHCQCTLPHANLLTNTTRLYQCTSYHAVYPTNYCMACMACVPSQQLCLPCCTSMCYTGQPCTVGRARPVNHTLYYRSLFENGATIVDRCVLHLFTIDVPGPQGQVWAPSLQHRHILRAWYRQGRLSD